MTYTISYRLPRAELVVSGTVRRSRDTLLDETPLAGQPAALVSRAFVLRHVAGGDEYVLTLPHGILRTFKGSFSFTPDRRLVSAVAESTGQAGTILTAAATVAGAALGAGVALSTSEGEDPVEGKYQEDSPEVAARRQRIATLLSEVQEAQVTVAEEVLADPADPGSLRARWDLLQEVRQSLESDLGVLDAHFAAWHAGTIETADESFEFTVPLTELKSTAGEPGEACTTELPDAPKTLPDLWRRYGVGVSVTWGAGRSDKQIPVTPQASQIATRIPDLVMVSIVEHQQGVPVVTASSRHLVMDDQSKTEYFLLEKSLFGRRSLALTFEDDGIVTGVAVEGAASLAEAASAIGQLPAAVASGLGSLNTTVSGVATARRAAQEAELAQVKQQVELEQQRITKAGLQATAADAARLQRLQQVKALLDTQTAIGKADPRLLTPLGPGADRD
jgi:hypothetical protein